jgi:hypothetical protein
VGCIATTELAWLIPRNDGMSDHDQNEGDIEPGLFTRLRPFAAWAFIATMIVGIAWAVLSWR